ncbi:MAG: flagellar assembly protein FliW [Sporolactobacillus sp.]
MKVQTKYFGEQEIDATDILSLPFGLPGFEEERQFFLQPFGEVFSLLQSVVTSQLVFVVVSPYLFFKNYTIDLPDAFTRQLAIEKPEDVTVLVIVSVQSPFSKSTVNLKAPLIINNRNRLVKQYIADHSVYSLREPLTSGLLAKKV